MMRTRRSLLLAAVAASTHGSAAWANHPREAHKPRPRMGINLAGLSYWSTELPFVDLMRMSGDWQLWRADNGQPIRDAKVDVDARGWLRTLPEQTVAMLPLAAISHLPAGRNGAPWVVRYEGRGEIDFTGALRVVQRAPGRLECEHVAQNPLPDPSLWLRIARIDSGEPLRNIRVLKPGTEAQPAANPWDAAFVARWSGWAALRLMDMLETNNSKLARWSDRPLPEDRSFAAKGLPLELAVDLANRCQAAPWLCMPHRADDDYLRRAATLVRERLDERLDVHVEHSNEVWNPTFEQCTYATQQALAQRLAKDEASARWVWHAKRSREIFAIWQQPFADGKRLKRVLATQADNAWGTQLLLRDPVVDSADALAVSAYLGLTPTAQSKPSSSEVARWPLERVFEHLEAELDTLAQRLSQHRRWAARHGLLLAGYEGGQHAVGVGEAAVRDAALERLLRDANRDERMGLIYRRLFDRWQDADGDLLCHFSSVAAPSRWGHWGLLEHHDDDPAMRPKYRVTLERMRKWRAAA